MSFREKSAWITLVTTIAITIGYLVLVISPRPLDGGSSLVNAIGPLIGAIVVLVMLHIVLFAFAAGTDREGAHASRDEREKLIALRADRAGFYTLQAGAFFVIVTLFWWVDTAIMANAVFFAMIAAEIARAGFTIVGFHRVIL